MIIKVILIMATIGLGYLAMRERSSVTTLALRRLACLALVVLGVIVILWPNLSTVMANAVGVGRGTDLLLYVGIMTFTFTTVLLYQRLHTTERRLTELVREMSLLEAQPESRTPVDEGM